jgi:hypothetical protein
MSDSSRRAFLGGGLAPRRNSRTTFGRDPAAAALQNAAEAPDHPEPGEVRAQRQPIMRRLPGANRIVLPADAGEYPPSAAGHDAGRTPHRHGQRLRTGDARAAPVPPCRASPSEFDAAFPCSAAVSRARSARTMMRAICQHSSGTPHASMKSDRSRIALCDNTASARVCGHGRAAQPARQRQPARAAHCRQAGRGGRAGDFNWCRLWRRGRPPSGCRT